MTASQVGTGTLTAQASGTTLALTVPTVSGGILSTDWLVHFGWSSSATLPSTPAGWTSAITATAGGSSPGLRISIKKAAGGEDGATVNCTVPNVATKGVIDVWRGINNTTPQDVTAAAGGSATGAATMPVPAVTTTMTGVALIVVGAVNAAAGTFTPPTLPATFTERLDDANSPASTIDRLVWSGSGDTSSGGATNITQSGAARFATAILALRPATAPTQVGTVTATPGTTQVTLAWAAPADGGYPITDYVVQYRTNAGPGAWNTFADGTTSSTGAVVTGLTTGTAYDFQVAAVNGIGQGAYSAAVTATPTGGGSSSLSLPAIPTIPSMPSIRSRRRGRH